MWVRFPPGTLLIKGAYPFLNSELFWAHGMMLFGNAFQATQAMRRIGYTSKEAPPIDPQLILDLEAAIERTTKTVPPSFFGYTFLRQYQKGVLNDRMQLGADVEFVPSSLRPHCAAQRFDCLRVPRELRLWVTWATKN
jgi:hypothetical protein